MVIPPKSHQIKYLEVYYKTAKTALKLVKYGLHSPTYDLHPHIGGRHSVLYFTIQVTEKYSNSNVLAQEWSEFVYD